MNTLQDRDAKLAAWLDDGPAALPADTRQAIAVGVRTITRRKPGTGWLSLPPAIDLRRLSVALGSAAVVVLAVAVAFNFYSNSRVGLGALPTATEVAPTPSPTRQVSVDLGIFEPVAGRIVYEYGNGISAVDPAAAGSADAIRLSNEPGEPLGWTSDGTQLLVKRDVDLFVLHADGTETQVTQGLLGFRGATVSPDGSRVAFAAGIETPEGDCCSSFALYVVSALGGSPEKLVESQEGILEYPAFSPDGTRIAYDDGAGDHSHSVWLVNADGSDAHEILANDTTLGAGHVRGLAWSPAGDRIALGFEGFIYTFASDGSDFTQIAGADTSCFSAEDCAGKMPGTAITPYWSPDGSQVAYETGCIEGAGYGNETGCLLAIADADGSNVRRISGARPGPWHPGAPSPSVAPETAAPTPAATPVQLTSRTDTPLGWSSDGTRLLFQRNNENLFILHADGSETQVTDQLTGFSDILGSGRPTGATLSPDGSRVVFAGLTTREGLSCHNGALFAVDADGGPARVIFESQNPHNGIVRDPTFSPDGTQIAFADGYCDQGHSVWVMNADGSDAHQIVSSDIGPLGATHVRGLAWSPAGDRIALQVDDGIYTFAPDGSDFTQGGPVYEFCWPWRQC